jgi:hypothetical protein
LIADHGDCIGIQVFTLEEPPAAGKEKESDHEGRDQQPQNNMHCFFVPQSAHHGKYSRLSEVVKRLKNLRIITAFSLSTTMKGIRQCPKGYKAFYVFNLFILY